ncbi:MAG: sugar transferase [Actinomycetales bacterium]|nr:sugar transferase [Actinomycetales bacterium]
MPALGGARARAWDRWSGPAPFPQSATRAVPVAWESRFRRLLQVGDLGLAVLSAVVAYLVRFSNMWFQEGWVVLATPLVWVAALALSGAYRPASFGTGVEEYAAVGRASFGVFAGAAIVSYLLNAELARGFVLPFVGILAVSTLTFRWGMRRWLASRRAGGDWLRDVLVVGGGESVEAMIREFRQGGSSGYRIVGACLSSGSPLIESDRLQGVPIFGSAESIPSVVDRLGVEVVAVASDPEWSGPTLRRLGWALAERRVDLVVAPGIFEVAGPRISLRPTAGMSLLHVERPKDDRWRLLAKRLSDLALAAALVLALLPLGALVALAIRLESRGPIFFLQERVGTHGRRFRMVKFRSMVVDAEERKALVSGGNEVNAVLFKHKADPRITRVGKALRRLSIDELPQLLNVIRGDMSLVGPRPPLPAEVAQYDPDALQRLRVRPGMTGLWQVSGRSDLTWEQSLKLDLWYVDNWTLALDLQILARTSRAVLGGSGAF